jgi:beta-galactosidase
VAALQIGDRLTGTLYGKSVDLLEGSNARVLARLERTGDPAIVSNRYGDGETMMIGTFLGKANHPATTEENNRFILGLADWANIDRPVRTSHDGVSDDPVVARLQENDNGLVLFLINHGETEESVSLAVDVDEDGEYTLHEITGDTRSVLPATGRQLRLETDLPGRKEGRKELE